MKNTALFSPSRIRRNHALEHATLNVLSRQGKLAFLFAYSDFRGFWIVGRVDTQLLQQAVDEALVRLQKGEAGLAISANCGTNYAASGLLAGLAAWLGMFKTGDGWKRKLQRLPLIVSLVTIVIILSQPLGPLLQARITTQPTPGSLHITGIRIYENRGIPVHRILTGG